MTHRRVSVFEQIRRALAGIRMFPKFAPLAWHYLDHGDDWKAVPCPVADYRFGSGYQGGFGWYLQGECHVQVQTSEEICAWLADCEYDHDRDPLSGENLCQHPAEFEQTRKGVCVDHAMWAWRKLIECGYQAEFVVGTMPNHEPSLLHAWVIFESDGHRFNLESARKVAEEMIRPLNEVREEYSPHCSVNGMLVRRVYGGICRYFRYQRVERNRTRDENRELAP